MNSRYRKKLVRGAVAGLAGGLTASCVMNGFQALWNKVYETPQPGGNGENATVKAAKAVSEGVFQHRLSRREKKVAAPAVHFGFGGLSGAIYGASAEVMPECRVASGAMFGAILWLTADEMLVPAFGLSKAPVRYPPSVHVQALASHIVYGVTTDLVRRAVRQAL